MFGFGVICNSLFPFVPRNLTSNHSDLKLFTGFINAALIAW